MKIKLKEKLLAHYADKAPSKFYQYDAFVDSKSHDSVVSPDPLSEVSVMGGLTTELMDTCNEVRVLISESATKSEAIRGLKAVLSCVENEACSLQQTLHKHHTDHIAITLKEVTTI
jgi:hypothetical protein